MSRKYRTYTHGHQQAPSMYSVLYVVGTQPVNTRSHQPRTVILSVLSPTAHTPPPRLFSHHT